MIGVAATAAAVGLGVLVASDTTAHSSVAVRTPTTSTSTSSRSATGSEGHDEHRSDRHLGLLRFFQRVHLTQLVRDADHDDTHDHGHRAGQLVHRSGDHIGSDMIDTGATTEADPRHEPPLVTRSMGAIGTTVSVVVTDPDRADDALAMMAEDLRDLDAACSRFRPDSELRRLERTGAGRPVVVSPLLFELCEVAMAIAVRTAGIVDPTVGSALIELGYDRDFDEIANHQQVTDVPPEPAPGWWRVEMDANARTVAVPPGVHLDFGAVAKAWAADRAADRIAARLGCGALVNLGGDVAMAGSGPAGGWAVGIAARCTTPLDSVDQVVVLHAGGLATSGTTARSWAHGGRTVHHIIDPWTGAPAAPVWSLVSTAAATCVDANAWSTAAVVWGDDAVGALTDLGVPARLVGVDGRIVHVGDWPSESATRGVANPASADDGRGVR